MSSVRVIIEFDYHGRGTIRLHGRGTIRPHVFTSYVRNLLSIDMDSSGHKAESTKSRILLPYVLVDRRILRKEHGVTCIKLDLGRRYLFIFHTTLSGCVKK